MTAATMPIGPTRGREETGLPHDQVTPIWLVLGVGAAEV